MLETYFNKVAGLQACILVKKRLQNRRFEYCDIFKNTYSEVRLQTKASVLLKSKLQIMSNNVIYILTENFISSFKIYKILSYLHSFANFSSAEFAFASRFSCILFPTSLATSLMFLSPVA